MTKGDGLPPMYPALTNSVYLKDRLSDLPCLITIGQTSKIHENVAMPGIELSLVDMSNLINYITHEWGNQTLSINEIEEELDKCGNQ